MGFLVVPVCCNFVSSAAGCTITYVVENVINI